MNLIRKGSLGILILLALGSIGTWQAKAWWERETAPIASSVSAKTVVVDIPSGSSAQSIGDRLIQAGVIRSKPAWQTWTRIQTFSRRQGGFQAGSYEVSPQESLTEIGNKIWTGNVVQSGFTVPEGWNIRQMAAYFESQKFFKAQDFLTAVQQFPSTPAAQKYTWLPPNLPFVEGFLFPDTYQISAGAVTPEQIITVMIDRFEKAALPIYQAQQGKNPLKLSLLQWVTLASIVEKEAVIPTERPVIAGVFSNRLTQGMSLGSDPTVEYAFGITQTPENPLTLAQVRTPSPYNTYINVGLPPTPIASPGLASLEATLVPQATEYLYFVARYDGTHVFSKTLGDHESAQDKIRDRFDAKVDAKSNAKVDAKGEAKSDVKVAPIPSPTAKSNPQSAAPSATPSIQKPITP